MLKICRISNDFSWEQMQPLLDEMKLLAEKYDVKMSAIAINWVIRKGAIPLAGARTGSQAEQVRNRSPNANWGRRLTQSS